MTKFNTGDRVKVTNGRVEPPINHNGMAFNGMYGTVFFRRPGQFTGVKIDNGTHYDFYPDELSLLMTPNDFIADSPQPQQTKPKEENMRYVVLYKNLASDNNVNIQSQHPSEPEAKLKGEQLVASTRSTLQTKAYFTVAIVDMQTGKLVGSVTDAPPPVNWQNPE